MTVAVMLPVDGPVTGAYLATSTPWTATRPHHGVDFGVSRVPCRHCWARARVHAIYGPGKPPLGDGSFGRCVVVDIEGTPFFGLYAHLSSVTVTVGQYVEPGDIVGITGGSGMKDGVFSETAYADHLHVQLSRSEFFPRDKDAGSTLGDLTADPFFDLPASQPWTPMDAARRAEFWTALLARFDVEATPWRLAWFEEWQRWENTGARWNPLATTWDGEERNYQPQPWWNTFVSAGVTYHVYNYADFDAGVEFTAKTLAQSYYTHIRKALADQTVAEPVKVAAELDVWGTTGFAAVVRAGWQPPAEDARLYQLAEQVFGGQGRQTAYAPATFMELYKMVVDLKETVDGMAIGRVPPHRHEIGETGGVVE